MFSQHRAVWLSPKDVSENALEQIGIGTYGNVFKINHCGATCTAKQLHAAPKGFFSTNNCDEFLKQCLQISELRHPNLVQFLGVCLKQDRTYKRVPLLVMEMMEESLTSLLERCSRPDSNTQLVFRHKLSILLHVSYGLLYLHSHDPPIAHCRLSSNKVLLKHPGTDQMQVKISDSGVVSLIKHNTRANIAFPGNEFLPQPLENSIQFDTQKCSVDMFSYGGVVLHMVTQKWPKPLVTKYPKSSRTDNYEISRRSPYIKMISDDDADCCKLKKLVIQCLNDHSNHRPNINDAAEKLREIISNHSMHPDDSSSQQNRGANANQPSKVAGNFGHTDPPTAVASLWRIPMNKLGEFQHKFNEFDKQKHGLLSREKVVLRHLHLNKVSFSKIWRLCDQDQDDCITINEFCVLMWLAEKAQEGNPVPDTLPHELLASSGIDSGPNTSLCKDKQTDDHADYKRELEQMKTELKKRDEEIGEKNNRITFLESDCIQKDKEIEKLKWRLGDLPVAQMSKVENMVECVLINQPVSIAVLLRNNHGELVSGRKDCIEILSVSTKWHTSESLPLDIKNHSSGRYVVSFTIGRSGEYDLHIVVSGHAIPGMPCRIRCVKIEESALDPRFGPKVKPMQNRSASVCYCNVVLQVLNQSQGVAEIRNKYQTNVIRLYKLSSITDPNTPITIPFEVSGNPGPLLNELNASLDHVESDKMEHSILQPESLLYQLADTSKQQRFVQQTQEDSHELLRHILYELKKEEVNFIKNQVYFNCTVTADPQSQTGLSKDVKSQLKGFLRAASKVTTPIEEIFGGAKLNSVICRECMTPSQTHEPFVDISLGVINSAQNTASSNTNEWQHQHQYRKKQHRSNVSTGNRDYAYQSASKPDEKFDVKRVQGLLKEKHLPYLPSCDTKVATDLEASLAEHTEVDNMDEDNKFICNECTRNKGSGDDPVLCLVAKQIMINKLPKVLVLHIKRFTIGDYMVKKDSTHVSFPPILNMAPYCSSTCLEEFNDTNGNIFYGLYAAIEHKGDTLKSGHYVAYIRRRPIRNPTRCEAKGEYDQTAAHDGKWFYTSDLTIRECQQGFEQVKDCEAYMLFYELLPRNQASVV